MWLSITLIGVTRSAPMNVLLGRDEITMSAVSRARRASGVDRMSVEDTVVGRVVVMEGGGWCEVPGASARVWSSSQPAPAAPLLCTTGLQR